MPLGFVLTRAQITERRRNAVGAARSLPSDAVLVGAKVSSEPECNPGKARAIQSLVTRFDYVNSRGVQLANRCKCMSRPQFR